MTRHMRKVGFVNLPEDRLDLFSGLTRHPDYRAEVVIDFDTSAYSYKLAEILQVPTSSDLALLRSFPCHIVVIPNDRPDLKVELSDYLGDPPAIVLTVDEMSVRLDLPPVESAGPEATGDVEGAGWTVPLQCDALEMPWLEPTMAPRPPAPGAATPADDAPLPPGPELPPFHPDSPDSLLIERMPGCDRRPAERPAGADPFRDPFAPGAHSSGWSLPDAGLRLAPGAGVEPPQRPTAPSPERQLNAVLETLNLASDKQLLLERILQIAVTSVGGDAGSIMLLDESGEYLRIAAAVGLSEDVQKTTRQRIGEGVAGSVMLEGRGRILVDRLNDPRYRDGRERARIKAALCIPIKVGPRSIGVLNVSSDTRFDAFDGRDQELLERFGGEVAIVLLKAMRGGKSAERSLDTTLRAQVDTLMSLEAPLPQRLQHVAEAVGQAARSLACRIYLLDGTGRRLLPLGVHGTGPLTAAPPPVPVDAGLIGWAMKRGTPQTLLSAPDDADRRAMYYLPLGPDARLGLVEFEGVPVGASGGAAQFDALLHLTQYLASRLLMERSTRLMARRSRQILNLSDLAVELTGDRPLDELLDMALASASGLFDADLAIIRLLPEGTVALSDQEMADNLEPATRALLAFDDDLGGFAGQRPHPFTGAQLPPELTGKLVALDTVRWIVGAPLTGPRGPVGVLTLYGLSEASMGLESDELAVLEKFCGHLGRALHRAVRTADETPMEGFMRWNVFQERVAEEMQRADKHDRDFTVTVFEISGLDEATDRRGRLWLGAAREALNRYIAAHIGPSEVATRVREGRLAILSSESDGGGETLCQRLTAGWPEAASASGVEGLCFIPFEVDYFSFPRDSRNHDEFIDMVADRFGGEPGLAAG